MMNTMVVRTKPCPICGKESTLVVDVEGFKRWQGGELVQRAFPDMSKGDRERLLSGTHDECWTQMFKGEG